MATTVKSARTSTTSSVGRRPDDDPVTMGDLRKVMTSLRKVNERVSECFEAITTGDDAQAAFWDEHEEKLNRLRRSLSRLEKRVASMEEG
jgi:hypothetical protein